MPFSLQTSITPGRSIVFLICLSLTVMLSMSSSKTGVEPLVLQDARFFPRQNSPSSQIVSSVPLPSTPTTTSTSRDNTSTQSSRPPDVTPSTPSTTTSETSTTPRQDTSTTPPPQSQTPPPSVRISSVQSTGSDGLPTIVVVTVVASGASSSSPSPTPTSDGQNNNDNSSSGLGTGSIIGLSVAGGIALLGIIAFFVWKFTRKRWSATYDDGERCQGRCHYNLHR